MRLRACAGLIATECIIAARALGETGDESAVEPLKNAALGWSDCPQGDLWNDRLLAIADAIGEIGGDTGAGALIEILEQPAVSEDHFSSSVFRPYVAKALSMIEDNAIAATGLNGFLSVGDIPVVYGAYKYFIVLGKEGSEDLLIDALEKYDDENMAVTFMNSGNKTLSAAAKQWAKANGYSVTSIPGSSGGTSWGSGG